MVSLFVLSKLHRIGGGAPTLWRAIHFTQSTDLNINLILNHPHGHTQNNVSQNFWAPWHLLDTKMYHYSRHHVEKAVTQPWREAHLERGWGCQPSLTPPSQSWAIFAIVSNVFQSFNLIPQFQSSYSMTAPWATFWQQPCKKQQDRTSHLAISKFLSCRNCKR